MVSNRSNGIYRSVITAIAGLILIGSSQPPKSSNQGSNTDTAAKINDAANSISSAIIQAGKSGEKDGGCQDRKDKRNSDLCAQWKAADAARDSADFAFWTLLISTFGTGLLIWTLWETRETSRRELRAYVKFSIPDQGLDLVAGKPIKIKLEIVNYGHTPAVKASFQHACGIGEPEWKWSADQTAIRNNDVSITLHRDSPVICEIQSHFMLSSEALQSISAGKSTIFARGTYFYDDVFGRKHITQVSLEIRDIEIRTNRVRMSPTGNIST
jgi:hypothetical protein